ncbi:uncharacterized protein [Drosophila pseudoobscura]|uniref:Uncharacterized protein isoform X2 n=1 Tax=Drosophila pseudoobscura pseudoobscura TaxID=46245 RepID=A0A6I8VFA8_DROPS|nr:uncharacterized protein LOC26533374 isoform X2 [Drosophila pseudoobscura]
MDKRREALTFRVLQRSRDFPALLPVCMVLDRSYIYDRVHRVLYLSALTCSIGRDSLWTQTALPRSFLLPRLVPLRRQGMTLACPRTPICAPPFITSVFRFI